MFGSLIRRTAFWTLDTIQGGKVKKHYRDIAEKMSGRDTVEPALKEILSYVSKNVPYYQGHEYQRLEDFPVINKKEIMANYDAFRSREFPDTDALHEVATSGSSGNPFHAFQNADKRRRVIAELAYIHDSVGWKIGDRYVFLRAWTGHYNSLGFQQFKQNFIPVEVTRFDEKAMNDLRQTLKKDRNIEVIIGYSSSLSELASYMLAQGDSPDMFSIRVIIADSDTLTPEGKRNLEKVFGCPVINRYDNEEQGILAYTKPYTDELTVNAASYYVEILAMEGDYPAKPGETGRVVVTDMYNKAMAFIRYDTGDLAIAGEMDGTRCLTLKSLQGRTSDVVFALTIYILLSALCLVRPEGKNHDKGLTTVELTLETTQDGNQERRTYENSDGEPVIPLDRDYATLLRTKDDDGNVVLEQYLDVRGEPVLRSGNYAAVSYRREAGEMWITYLDAQLKPTTITSGYSSIHRTLTPDGKALRDTYFDLLGKPVKNSGGYYGFLRGYDDRGRVREIVYLDAYGNPIQIKAGYSREVRVLDDAGRIAAVYYRDAENNPVPASQGQYGEGYRRDENGRVTLITYLDVSGNPASVNVGYTMLSRSYYRDGYPFEDRYFDSDGDPFALSKGQYGIRRVGDVTLQLDRSGHLMLSIDNLLNGLPMMVVLVGCLVCIALCCLPRKPRLILLAAYVVFIFYETLMFRESGDPRTALIPFSYLKQFALEYTVRAEVIDNIWLFIPLGAGLYSFCPKRKVLWLPFALTLFIETAQFATGLGLAQTDDVIGNTLGGIIGFLMAGQFKKNESRI